MNEKSTLFLYLYMHILYSSSSDKYKYNIRITMSTLVSLKQLLLFSYRARSKSSTIEKRLCTTMTSGFVKEITKKVKSYGKLYIDLPWNVEVKPTDPHEYPDMDTLVVKISSIKHNGVDIEKYLKIDANEQFFKITANDGKFDNFRDMLFTVEAPIQYDIDARTSGESGLTISSMISDSIDAKTENGDIIASKLQSKKMKFNSSQGGSIDLRKSLQGDIQIFTVQNGSVRAEKCLGMSLEISSENGDVTLGSNYCEKAVFTTINGNLTLNNLHMAATVDIQGNGSLHVSCLDGSLQAKVKNGDTKIQVVRLTGKSHIISEGFIDLIVPKENNIKLTLSSNKLSVDESLKGINTCTDKAQVFETGGDIPLKVETCGNVRLTGSSWAESLRFGKFAK